MAQAFWGVAGFLFGSLVAALNYRLSLRFIQKAKRTSDVMKVSLLRQMLNILALVVAFIIGKWLLEDWLALLVGTALGLTLSAQLLAFRLYRRQAATQQKKHPAEQDET